MSHKSSMIVLSYFNVQYRHNFTKYPYFRFIDKVLVNVIIENEFILINHNAIIFSILINNSL